jgi:hypothetical protein
MLTPASLQSRSVKSLASMISDYSLYKVCSDTDLYNVESVHSGTQCHRNEGTLLLGLLDFLDYAHRSIF